MSAYGFNKQGVERIVETVRDREAAGEPGVQRTARLQPNQDVAPRWFELTANLLNDGTPAGALWLKYSAKDDGLVADIYVAGLEVVDQWGLFWGVMGQRGAAVPVPQADKSTAFQVVINPGSVIYSGNAPDWTTGATVEVTTPIDSIDRAVDVTDPNYIGADLTLEAGPVRYYFNRETSRFELLDAPRCPA